MLFICVDFYRVPIVFNSEHVCSDENAEIRKNTEDTNTHTNIQRHTRRLKRKTLKMTEAVNNQIYRSSVLFFIGFHGGEETVSQGRMWLRLLLRHLSACVHYSAVGHVVGRCPDQRSMTTVSREIGADFTAAKMSVVLS